MSDKIAEELEQHRVRFERVKELRNIGFNVVPLGIKSKALSHAATSVVDGS